MKPQEKGQTNINYNLLPLFVTESQSPNSFIMCHKQSEDHLVSL